MEVILILLVVCCLPLGLSAVAALGDYLEKKILASRFRDEYLKANLRE